MLVARTKMVVDYHATPAWDSKGDEVRWRCEYDQDNPQDTAFVVATPSGGLNLHITNPDLVGKFHVGEHYHIEVHTIGDEHYEHHGEHHEEHHEEEPAAEVISE